MLKRSSLFLPALAIMMTMGFVAESPALAQEPAQEEGQSAGSSEDATAADSPEAEAGEVVSDEVFVIARRRKEVLQSVPDSVTAFSAEQIEMARIDSFRDVADLTPSLSQLDNFRPGLARVQVRGLITPQVGDPPLVFVVDGVTAPDLEFINQDLVDIEQIEVLRGAQGALYGRGAIGGAVIVETRKPSFQPEGKVALSYGNGNRLEASALASGPLGDGGTSSYRFGGFFRDSDGLIDNEFLGEEMDGLEESSMFGQLSFYPTDKTSLAIKGRYSQTDAGFAYYQGVTEATKEDFSIETSQNVFNEDQRDLWEISARLLHEVDLGTLEISLGHAQSGDDAFADQDYSAVPSDFIFHFAGAQEALTDVEALTAEARLTSASDQAVRWSLGAFYQDRQRDSHFNFYDDDIGDQPLRRQYFLDNSDFLLLGSIVDNNSSEAWALSGQASYDVGEKWEITGALRYDSDKRESFDPGDVAGTFAEDTFSELQPKLSLAYAMSPDTLLYGGYSRGFRSGGFNEPAPGIQRVFDEETSDSYELGAKFSLLEGLLTLNSAVFLIEQDNAQVTQFNVDTFTLENLSIDEVSTKGLEVEVAYRPTDALTLRMSGDIVDSEIEAFVTWPDLVGSVMPWVSEYSLALSADYVRTISDQLETNWRISYSRVGPRIFDLPTADIESSANDFVNLGVGVRISRKWLLQVFADNVFDERAIEDLFIFDDGVTELVRLPNKPARYGVSLSIDF